MNQGRARTRSHTSTSLLPRYEEVAMTFQIGRAAAAAPPPPPEQLGGGRTETEASFHFITFVPRCSSLLASYFLGDASDTKRIGKRQPAAAPLSQRAMVARGWKDEEGEKREKESRRRLISKEEGKAPSLSRPPFWRRRDLPPSPPPPKRPRSFHPPPPLAADSAFMLSTHRRRDSLARAE